MTSAVATFVRDVTSAGAGGRARAVAGLRVRAGGNWFCRRRKTFTLFSQTAFIVNIAIVLSLASLVVCCQRFLLFKSIELYAR